MSNRPGTSILTFDTLQIMSSELIEFTFNQTVNISDHPTIPNITLSQPGAISLSELTVKANITNQVQTFIPTLHSLFNGRRVATLTIMSVSYGPFYFSGLNYIVDTSDEVRRPLRLELDLKFVQAVETFS